MITVQKLYLSQLFFYLKDTAYAHSFILLLRVLLLSIIVCAIGLIIGLSNPLYIIAICIGSVLWFTGFLFPEIPLAIGLAGFHFYPTITTWINSGPSSELTIAFWLLIATSSVCGIMFRNERKNVFASLQEIPSYVFALLVLWHFISWLLFSYDVDAAQKRIVFMILMMISPYIAGLGLSKQQVDRLMKAIIVLGILGISIAIIRLGLNGGNFAAERIRHSISDEAGALQFTYAIGLSSIIALSSAIQRRRPKWWLLAGAMLSGTVLLTIAGGSRGPLLAIGVASLFLIIKDTNWSDKFLWLSLLLVIIMTIPVFLPFLPEFAVRRVDSVFQMFNSIDSATLPESDVLFKVSSGRSSIWIYSLNTWLQQPFTGIGIAKLEESVIGKFSHNFLIEILTDLGIIGMIFFIIFMFFVLRMFHSSGINSWRIPANRSIQVILIYSLVSMMFSGRLQTHIGFWLACGLILCKFRHLQNREY
jgi:hypothetical protein